MESPLKTKSIRTFGGHFALSWLEEVMALPLRKQSNLDYEQARHIVEECYDSILAYCTRHAPAGYEAADLAQETFLRFVRTRSYQDRGRPIAYLMTIARNVCIDAGRKNRLQTVPLDFEPADPEDEFCADVRKALESLPDEPRELLEMRYGFGLQVNEIARMFDESRYATRRKIKKALELLHEELKG
ncbi:Probable RNA polymerase sigma factor fecI [Slackia heliotrinireducens]|uniref:RNA polymerase sigma factor, sigma-70 family n=2 Tax=Slackia TaxID=84108 RepID=C7N5Q5_SLAHD|nr:sigma-70 family RNA polymerase sigma factor [Slackia heliotrinireducens]ACV22240.1 RNA polymerase sigma factor, sigma-70 family [Slackia heliotrinireducens DSM 20476]VEH00381.1 Probable RNA polymerase sigma factor fecI [Slackia heliotrinireducens]